MQKKGQRKMQILQFLAIIAIGGILGGVMGYFGKCSTGACPLTANPWRGATYGIVLAALFGSSLLFQRPVTGGGVTPRQDASAPQAVNAKVVKPVHIENAAQFEKEVLKAPGVCLVDFYADWCGPCRMLIPVVEKLANDMAGKVKFVKINVDENEDLANKYRVSSIPRLIIFKAGKIVDSDVGYQDEKSLRKWLSQYLGAGPTKKRKSFWSFLSFW